MDSTLSRKKFLSLAVAAAGASLFAEGCDDGTTGAGGASASSGSGASTTGTNGATGSTSGGMTTTTGSGAGTTGSSGSGGGSCTSDITAEISCPHDHMMIVTAADIAAGVMKTYDIKGTATHSHSVTLTPADFATLKSGGTVFKFVQSSVQDHCVTISCGTPGDPMTSGQCDQGNAFSCD